MKLLIGSGIVIIGGLASARAALIYDGFDYAAGADLAGQIPSGTNAWAATGTNGTGGSDAILVTSGSLTIPGLAAPLGNSITFGGLGLTDRIAIGSAVTSGTIYYSLAFKVEDVTGLTATGGFMAGFNNSVGTQTGQPTVVGARLLTRASGAGYNIGISKNSSTTADFIFDPVLRNVGDTVFVVGSYTFSGVSGTDDLARLWINPDPLTFGLAEPLPTLSAPLAAADLVSIASFLFRQANLTAVPPVVIADELRVDTTWAGVTPIPEPSAALLGALAGGGFLTRRRPRR